MSAQRIPLAGVIGSPVAHSLSPRLHGYWLKTYGIGGYYIPIDLPMDGFERGLRSLPALGFRGVNITIPYKETALTVADVISDRAALIGAANTLTFRRNGDIQADNTDGYGFIANIRQQVPDWNPGAGPAVVIGAGGAARAVLAALIGEGVREIRLVNRTRARAEMLAEHFGARIAVVNWHELPAVLKGAAFLVNSTSLGMTGNPALRIDLGLLPKKALVTDIVYAPLRTPLLEAAAARGCRTVDGLGMLLHQAVPGFEAWFRRKPVVDEGLRAAMLAP